METMGDDCCICELCSALFKKKSNLTRHIQNVHYREKKFMCEHCSKNYITKDALTNHITNSHSNKPRKKRIVYWQCPMCIHQCEKEQMVDHYKLFHNYDISTINIQFDSFNEFLSWKQKIEKQSSSKYIRHRKKKYSDKWKYFYRCHRDGFYRAKGNNLRKLKKIGSNKINAHCPAKIDVTINETNGKISINYFQNHIGHSLETFRLSSNCKEKADGEYTEETDSDNEEANELSIEEKSINERSEEINEIPTNIDSIKASLLERFQLILTKVENLEECEVVNEELLNFENILYNCKYSETNLNTN